MKLLILVTIFTCISAQVPPASPGDFDLLLVTNFVAIAGTAFTCTSTAMTPLVFLSCTFNLIAGFLSSSLSILVGVDTLIQDDPLKMNELFDSLKLYSSDSTLVNQFNNGVELVRTACNENVIFKLDGTKCIQFNLSKFKHITKQEILYQEVCITKEGIRKLSDQEIKKNAKNAMYRMKKSLKHGSLFYLEEFTHLFGDMSEELYDKLRITTDKIRNNNWHSSSLIMKDDDNTLFTIKIFKKK